MRNLQALHDLIFTSTDCSCCVEPLQNNDEEQPNKVLCALSCTAVVFERLDQALGQGVSSLKSIAAITHYVQSS